MQKSMIPYLLRKQNAQECAQCSLHSWDLHRLSARRRHSSCALPSKQHAKACESPIERHVHWHWVPPLLHLLTRSDLRRSLLHGEHSSTVVRGGYQRALVMGVVIELFIRKQWTCGYVIRVYKISFSQHESSRKTILLLCANFTSGKLSCVPPSGQCSTSGLA